MNVYYNSSFGCLVCPETRMGNTPMRVVIEPVTVLDSGFTATALGEALLNALEHSRTAPPVPSVDLSAGRFWQVTGIKGYAVFSRKFQCVRINVRGPVLEIVKLVRDTDGGYIEPVGQPPLEIPADAPAAQLEETVLSLFSPGLESLANETLSFETVHGSIVSYRRPSDAFLDCGDGHTDAYQVFTLADTPKSHIAFLIDSGYKTLRKAAVLGRWQAQYGIRSEFRFQRRRKPPLMASMRGSTAEAEIIPHIYQDGDGMLEVLSLVEHALLPEAREAARAEYQAVIRTITVKASQGNCSEGPVVK